EITIASPPYFSYRLSNRGAVATSMRIEAERLPDGTTRAITGADGQPIELLPQQSQLKSQQPDGMVGALGIRLPWAPELAAKLNNVNFRIEGIDPGKSDITLSEGEPRKISFVYSSPEVEVRKDFTFRAGDLVFDAAVSVKVKGSPQPVELVLGPRFGDQSDKQTGSYSQPPHVMAYQVGDHVDHIDPRSIPPPFAKITGLDESGKRIELDKPLAPDVDSIQIIGSDGKISLGYAKVIDRDSSGRSLVLGSLPSGT